MFSLKEILVLCVTILLIASISFAASLNFTAPIPGAAQGSRGGNMNLEDQKTAITEIRTKMQNWATFSGYSAGTTR